MERRPTGDPALSTVSPLTPESEPTRDESEPTRVEGEAGEERPIGFGRLRRKEDARFIRGQGSFVDDLQLPGMLHGAVLRSPFAHARIVSIDASAALQHPKVHLVLTGADLAARGLAWMPTMSSDTQAVLATDKVRFQGQEVAFVVAEDRYAARDALELIDVGYEPLPVVVDVRRALDGDAPVIRDDVEGQRDNRIFDWEAGDAVATGRCSPTRRWWSSRRWCSRARIRHRWRPAARSPSMTGSSGKLTVHATTQAPHAHRTLMARILGVPEHKIRVVSPDIGGGFGNKVPMYPGYVCAAVATMTVGRPVKWMEDRSENLMSTGFARDYLMRGAIAATRTA